MRHGNQHARRVRYPNLLTEKARFAEAVVNLRIGSLRLKFHIESLLSVEAKAQIARTDPCSALNDFDHPE